MAFLSLLPSVSNAPAKSAALLFYSIVSLLRELATSYLEIKIYLKEYFEGQQLKWTHTKMMEMLQLGAQINEVQFLRLTYQ